MFMPFYILARPNPPMAAKIVDARGMQAENQQYALIILCFVSSISRFVILQICHFLTQREGKHLNTNPHTAYTGDTNAANRIIIGGKGIGV